jgi:hypothetical protein
MDMDPFVEMEIEQEFNTRADNAAAGRGSSQEIPECEFRHYRTVLILQGDIGPL